MADRLLSSARGAILYLLHQLHTLLWIFPLYALILLRLLLPWPPWVRANARVQVALAEGWIAVTNRLLRLSGTGTWEIEGDGAFDRRATYLMLCNHRSWVDVPVFLQVFPRGLPFPRFFAKRELLRLPLIGPALWGLDFPLMKRHSKAYLESHPGQRDRDLATTLRSCERLRGVPATMVNFPEGTRFTAAKHAAQSSPFHHLLRPKAGGPALVLSALGEQVTAILDMTIAYPDGVPSFWRFLCGRAGRVRVRVRSLPVPAELRGGDYQGDPVFRERFQEWINGIWGEKDRMLAEMMEDGSCRVE